MLRFRRRRSGRGILFSKKHLRVRRPVESLLVEQLEARKLVSATLPGLPGLPDVARIAEPPAVVVLREIDAPGISGVIQRTQELSLLSGAHVTASPGDGSAGSGETTGTANLGAFTININAGAALAANTDALDAFLRAAGQWESIISDPISVEIDADLGTFSSSNIIGGTSSITLFDDYSVIRDAMVLDSAAEADDQIVNLLPTIGQASFLTRPLHVIASGPTESLTLSGTKANLKALGFDPSVLDAAANTTTDATITFNQDFAFDFDNSDGIMSGTIDFETVAAHEIGHALGFVSEVDFVDALYNKLAAIVPRTLDMFRFQNDTTADPTTVTDFTPFSRNLVAGTEAVTDQIIDWTASGQVEWRMSTGVNHGDGRQASHWKDNGLTGSLIGMMDPTLAFGQTFTITEADMRALDLIGYDIARPGSGQNQAPVADAGADQSASVGEVVQLDGTNSLDPDNDPLGYTWAIVDAPEGSTAALLGGDTDTPTLQPDLAGSYVIELSVSDGFLSETDTVIVTATPVATDTVSIVKASYSAKKGQLTIEATSSRGGEVQLRANYFDTNGQMNVESVSLTYNSRKDKWSATINEPTQPLTVTVYFASDPTVSDTATVEAGGGGGGNGRPGNGRNNVTVGHDLAMSLAASWLGRDEVGATSDEDGEPIDLLGLSRLDNPIEP